MKYQVLVFSDIHNNIDPVLQLREAEKNVYDFVVVAGDIGNKISQEFFQLMDTFGCLSFVYTEIGMASKSTKDHYPRIVFYCIIILRFLVIW